MPTPFPFGQEKGSGRDRLLLDDGVVAIGEQLFLDRGSLHAIRERSYLNMQQLVLWLTAHYHPITTLTQSRDQHFGILRAGHSRDLYHRLP